MIKRGGILAIIAVLLLAAGLLYVNREWIEKRFFKQTDTQLEQGLSDDGGGRVKIVAQNLDIPWEIVFLPAGRQGLPAGDMLVTERSGKLKRIGANSKTYVVHGVRHIGEGGLLGMALHPQFKQNRWLYLYLTTNGREGLVNRVERYRYTQDRLTDRRVIVSNIPGAANHDGGRLAFGPDGYLYISTGDAGQPQLSQSQNSLAGKILRLDEGGHIPPDNPFNNAVYSYGHRNVQGLAWDEEKRLWATEHGRSGLRSGYDELNLIKKGANYGWPVIEGDRRQVDMVAPVAHSGPSETWAPAGLAYYNGSLFFAGLRGQTLYEAILKSGTSVALRGHFRGDFGRLRAVVHHKNFLYVSTSNTDGRGESSQNDDKIIRLMLAY